MTVQNLQIFVEENINVKKMKKKKNRLIWILLSSLFFEP